MISGSIVAGGVKLLCHMRGENYREWGEGVRVESGGVEGLTAG